MDVMTLLVMVVQFLIGFVVKRINAEKAKLMVPTVSAITSLIYQAGLAFAAAASGTAPAIMPSMALAGFLGSFGNIFLDVLKDTLLQTFLVTGAHSAPKNFRQGLAK